MFQTRHQSPYQPPSPRPARSASRAAARPYSRPVSRARSAAPADRAASPATAPATADVLRTIRDSRTPVFVTVRAGGRRRYGYWQPYDSRTNKGGCYVALPTAVCDELYSAGRLTLGEPLEDPTKTTYRVLPTSAPTEPARIAAAPARLPATPTRAVSRTPAPAHARDQRLAA
ncbi:hypothetical protein [Streptomyces niger]|uniref:hypothetical protein n=1 Tax=Streptomyces niger TaxID=66373 RepID=UPI001F469DFF|nr:hypothetical protein [Streptomyces niger]